MAYILTERPRRTAGGAWLERVNPLHGLTIAQARNIFDAARAHGSPLLQRIYDEIELADPVLGVCVDRRQAALAELGWRITPRPSADPGLAAEQKDALDAFVRGIGNLSEAVEHLDLAFFRGFSVAQPIWEGGGVRRVALLESWNFLFGDGGGLLWNPDCSPDPADCVEVTPAARVVEVRRRRPIDYPALAIHIRKYLGERDWGRFIERYGIPPVDVVMAPNATEGQKGDYLEAADAARDGRSVVWPSGTPQPSRAEGSRGQDPFTAFIEHQERLIVLRATGGTLTSLAQADTGSLAGGAQMDVWDQIVKRDSSVLSDALNRQLFWRYLEGAFPGRAPAVEFSIGREQEPTAAEAADLAVKLRSAGYAVDKAELEEATGFTLEREAPAPAPGGIPGGPAFNRAAGAPRQAVAKPLQNAPAEPDGQREGADAPAPAGAFSRAFAQDLGPAAGEVEELLTDPAPERAGELLGRLPGLLPEDPALAAAIAEETARAYAAACAAAGAGKPGGPEGPENPEKPENPALNREGQPRGKTTPESTPGSFAPAGGAAEKEQPPEVRNDGRIDFRGNARAKAKADAQAQGLGYAGIDDLMEQSTGVSPERIAEIVAGGDQPCKPHEAIAALRSRATIPTNASGEEPVKLTERPIRHYVCGERRHHNGVPDVSRLSALPSAIMAIRKCDSCHHEYLEKRVIRMPGEQMPKGTQTVFERSSGPGKSKAFAYTDSGVLNGWQLN